MLRMRHEARREHSPCDAVAIDTGSSWFDMSRNNGRPRHLRAVPGGFPDQASRLRALAADPKVRVRYTRHALEEMAKDGLVRIDVENMLRRCCVTLVEQCQNEETWRAQGSDNNGSGITAVVVAYEDTISIKIITAWG